MARALTLTSLVQHVTLVSLSPSPVLCLPPPCAAPSVSGLLQVARSLGDWDVYEKHKIPGVSAEADVTEMMLQDQDEFLLV